MIRIDEKIDTRNIENLYQALEQDINSDLGITRKLSPDFGLVPAIIQFISTWHHKSTCGKIILIADKEEDIDRFYNLDYFFTAIVYCWSRTMVDSHGSDLKGILRNKNSAYHEKMRRQEEGGGPKMLLANFDHLSKQRGLLNAFYIDGEFIQNEFTFGLSIDKSLKQVISFNREMAKANMANAFSDIIDIIYELMKNTHDWATTDEFGMPISPNSRGLFLKFHKKRQDTFRAEFHDHVGLSEYFSDRNFVATDKKEIYFLELSVFDTGIGFVKRYTQDSETNFGTKEQIDIIKECLVVNNTSAIGLNKTVKGKGLDRIMQILDNKGFLWLRTSEVSVCRNFTEARYVKGCQASDIDLYDWRTNSTTEFSKLSPTIGSVLTLVYPISNASHA